MTGSRELTRVTFAALVVAALVVAALAGLVCLSTKADAAQCGSGPRCGRALPSTPARADPAGGICVYERLSI